MKRSALILKKDMAVGQVGNVCAILMAQVARALSDVVANEKVTDLDGVLHAAPQYSIVVLKANGSAQLENTMAAVHADEPELVVFGFSDIGQNLNNAFKTYRDQIATLTTEQTRLVGVAIAGDDDAVRRATKKFSVM